MKKKEIQNIVNEEVSKLQSIVIQEVRAHKSINEKIDKAAWDKANDDQRIGMLLTVVKDPDEAELHFEKEWNELPSEVTSNLQESVWDIEQGSCHYTETAAQCIRFTHCIVRRWIPLRVGK